MDDIKFYDVYCGDNGYFLMRDGEVIRKRMRRFRKASWSTYAGALAAARTLNDELLAAR